VAGVGSVTGRPGVVGGMSGGAGVKLVLGAIGSEVTTPFGGLSGGGDNREGDGEVSEHVNLKLVVLFKLRN